MVYREWPTYSVLLGHILWFAFSKAEKIHKLRGLKQQYFAPSFFPPLITTTYLADFNSSNMSASKTSTSRKSASQTTYLLPTISWSTNAGPLTTPATLPANCLDELWNLKTKGLMPGAAYTYFTQGCAISSCCPSSTPYSRAYEWLSTYYSPAVCPQSYRACAPPPSFTVEVDEKVAFCCPV